MSESRTLSRLEQDDKQHCKECGMEIEVDTSDPHAVRYDPFKQEHRMPERCAGCRAEIVLSKLSEFYGTDVKFSVTVEGMKTRSHRQR